jgi:thiaminase
VGLAKFLKGCTTIGELMEMPNIAIHTYYKLWIDTMKSKEASEAVAQEQVVDEIEDQLA